MRLILKCVVIHRVAKYVGTALAFAALTPAVAWSQSSGIAGVVTDQSGAVLPGVTVEASSPVLIEGSRSTTSDGNGRYTIAELRPGSYTVTFTLSGFSMVRREGILLSATFTANVNVQMRVGTLEDVIVVTGSSPIVDVRSVVRQRLVDSETIEALPTGKSWSQLGVTTVGVTSTLADVGGSAGENQNPMAAHGGASGDKVIEMEGQRLGLLGAGGAYASTGVSSNDASTEEVSFEIGGISAESSGGGVRVNVIPKEGGNTFKGSVFGNFANRSMSSDNFSGVEKFALSGVRAPDRIKQIYDVSYALGGPIKKNQIWFFTAHRHWGFQNYKADAFYEANPIDYIWDYAPGRLTPSADAQAFDDQELQSHNIRITTQLGTSNKLSAYYDYQSRCTCHWQVSATRSGEASVIQRLPTNWQGTVTYTSTLSDKLLFSAGFGTLNTRWTQIAQTDRVPIDPATQLPSSFGYSVYDIGYNITYRAPANLGQAQATNYSSTRSYRASLSYITGAHSAKVGFGVVNGPLEIPQFMGGPAQDSSLVFNNGTPVALIRLATPTVQRANLDADFGVFAQDQWQIQRFTVNAGIRYDWLNESVPSQHFDAGTWVPARNYPAVEDVPNWKDISPRLGISYDVFGNGKTAVKASLNRYLIQESTATAQANNPINLYRFASQQVWRDLNGDSQPQPSELTGPQLPLTGQPGGAGPVGSEVPLTRYDPDLLTGWGKRRDNWELSAGVQHEIFPRVSADVSYFRRSQGHFTATDNRAVTPADYQEFCVTTPNDSRLPNPSSVLCGNFDLTPQAAARTTDNVVLFNDSSEEHTEVWTGVDVSITARFGSSERLTFLAGGMSTGRTAYSNCGVIDNPGLFTATTNLTGAITSRYCDWTTKYRTQIKLAAVHTFWKGIQASATFQSNPGPMVRAIWNATNVDVLPSLGRPLAGYPSGYPIDLIEPGTQYGERLNQLDLRFAKLFNLPKGRVKAMVDIYNTLNANPVVALNTTYGPNWLRPTQILVARFVKVGAQFEF
jgi:Carboxypeptidase regulatory-like domain